MWSMFGLLLEHGGLPNTLASCRLLACVYQVFMAPQPHGCAFGTQLNFIRTCPFQAKDKIMLLIQKLGGRIVRPNGTRYRSWEENLKERRECHSSRYSCYFTTG